MTSGSTRPRLSRQDWIAAALRALVESGPDAVAIEPLAAALGATKGSGYHHFRSRGELLEAALQEYLDEHTRAIVDEVENAGGTARDRYERLFATVEARHHHGRRSNELQLLASNEPAVRAMMERISSERIGYLESLMRQAGFGGAEAHRRATIAYLAYIGQQAMVNAVPSVMPQTRAANLALQKSIIDVMLSPEP